MKLATAILFICLISTLEAKPNIFKKALNKIKKVANEVVGMKQTREEGDTRPWFCHDLQCPEFKTIREIKVPDSDMVIEERCYKETNWVQTAGEGDDAKKWYNMFQKLFAYIGKGENVKHEKIDMTAPVLVSVDEESKSHSVMGFFIPPADVDSAPAPTREDVKINKISPMCVYVLSYGGWQMSMNNKFWSKVDTLKEGLKKAGVNDVDEAAGPMFAGYDSPWRLINRHNEVMVLKKSKLNPEVRDN